MLSRTLHEKQQTSVNQDTISNQQPADALLAMHAQLVELMLGGCALPELMARLLQLIAAGNPRMGGSLLLLDAQTRQLHQVAAAGLPEALAAMLESQAIGSGVAAEQMASELAVRFEGAARTQQLRVCGVEPIIDAASSVLGMIVMFRAEVEALPPEHRRFLQHAARVAAPFILQLRPAGGVQSPETLQSLEALRNSKQLIEGILNSIPVRVFWKDRNLIYQGCNTIFARDAGFAVPEDVIGKDDYQMGWHAQAELYRRDDKQVIDSGQAKLLIEEPQTTPDGRELVLLTSKVPLRDASGEISGVLGTYADITERRQAERKLEHAHRALKTLSAGNSAVVHAQSEPELLRNMCDVIVEAGAYAMAWVGYVDKKGVSKMVQPVAWAGAGASYVQQAYITWDDTARGLGPTGRCIRTCTPQVARFIDSDPSMAPWRETAKLYGYQSSLTLPLKMASAVIGGLMIYAREGDAFDGEEQELLAQLASELSYGIETLRIRSEHERGQRDLERSMEATVQALASTMETRDPYTAGHQKQVADIASAIAAELAMPAERIKGLRLAASVHDIGNVHVPSEILVKPARLSPAEYECVKSHARTGYEILKDIEFPWPLAEIVYQHHERLDGSGYPRGLSGDQILLDARIIAVADVLAAIASERPYRSARDLDAALDELIKGRGVLYDSQVVDACLRLVRNKAYRLPLASSCS